MATKEAEELFIKKVKEWHKNFNEFMSTDKSNNAELLELELEKLAPIYEIVLYD